MKKFIGLLLLSSAIGHAEPLADQVSGEKLWGRGQFGECTPFAVALYDWLRLHQQSSRVIFYTYRPSIVDPPITHAIVAWERAGSWWAMGNELPKPRLIGQTTPEPLTIARLYDARAYTAMRVR